MVRHQCVTTLRNLWSAAVMCYWAKFTDAPFYMAADQFEYWKNTHLTIDVTEGRGASFSLEIPLGVRFVVVSRLFSDEESANLNPIQTAGHSI